MDSKLSLKPSELIDIGIDKYTKIPIPILNENMIPTFEKENGVPVDSFEFYFDSNYSDKTISATLYSDKETNLSINFGDSSNIFNFAISTGGTVIEHVYATTAIYKVILTGWIERIKSIIILSNNSENGGVVSIFLKNVKRLYSLNLSNNRLTNIDISGLIYLNNINLNNNYLTNDVIDDLYIDADTFLTYSGDINTSGDNNGKPTVYSESARSSLNGKDWRMNYNI